jgi:hypothetical protein
VERHQPVSPGPAAAVDSLEGTRFAETMSAGQQGDSDSQTLSTLGAARRQDALSVGRLHAPAETMHPLPAAIMWLESSLHRISASSGTSNYTTPGRKQQALRLARSLDIPYPLR